MKPSSVALRCSLIRPSSSCGVGGSSLRPPSGATFLADLLPSPAVDPFDHIQSRSPPFSSWFVIGSTNPGSMYDEESDGLGTLVVEFSCSRRLRWPVACARSAPRRMLRRLSQGSQHPEASLAPCHTRKPQGVRFGNCVSMRPTSAGSSRIAERSNKGSTRTLPPPLATSPPTCCL